MRSDGGGGSIPGEALAGDTRSQSEASQHTEALDRSRDAAGARQSLTVLDAALKYAAAGFPVFPCRNVPGLPGHKAPLTARGFKDATTDRAQIEAWWRQHPQAFVAVPTGAASGLAVLDIDAKNGKDGFAAVPGWESMTPLRSRTGSGGAHLFFRASEPIRSTSNVNGHVGVDTRGEGGYAIVPPSSGYEWVSGGDTIDPLNLPHFPLAYLPRYQRHESSDEGLLADEPELVEPALRAIPNDDLGWDEWNRVGMMTFAATGGSDEGFDAWDEWSQKSSKYSAHETRKKWDRFFRSPPTGVGMGTLRWMANEADPDWLDKFELAQEAAARASFDAGQAIFEDMVGSVLPKPEPAPDAPEKGYCATENGAGAQAQTEAEPTASEPSETTEGPFSLKLEEWNAGGDDWQISPRAWLLGNVFCRGFVSALIADGGVGKTAWSVLQGLSCATGRALSGEHVFERCRVLLLSLEDDREELRRRVRAAMIAHDVKPEEVDGWLFLSAPEGKAGKLVNAALRGNGRVKTGAMLDELKAAITGRNIDLLIIDPLVKAHDVEENDNSAMDIVISTASELAISQNIAVCLLHHTSKGAADPGNADRGRGASAVKNGARSVYTLTAMSSGEAELFNITEASRRSFVRLDSGKVNITPSLDRAKWFELVGVNLGNGNPLYPHGDNVQSLRPWSPPDAWGSVGDDTRQRILDEIEAGVPEGEGHLAGSRYSNSPRATWRAAWPVVSGQVPDLTERQARKIISDWLKTRVLVERDYHDPNDRRSVKGLFRATKENDDNVPM
ncbi:AAA family ATPase [Tsuneonella sp. YG55]|uniref:AAA family ATPase n=1 Tax=Tsuneonella litorea TaxID=2976475 RepID=A0A9X3A806_9SPHN|nr:AAA family ATPase [Tsuneonella litorea]MCT2557370.1 AAA family ATPase [Tsuneonella litorea]